LKFFSAKGDYKQLYTVTGDSVPGDANATYSAAGGQIACNAVGVLACNDTVAWKFVEAFWKQSTPSGTYRYYSGLLHMLGLLHCSGKFKIYGNPGLVGVIDNNATKVPEISKLSAHGIIMITDVSGHLLARYDAGKGVDLAVNKGSIGFSSKALHLPAGVYYAKFVEDNGSIAKKLLLVK
jgi:hypothetical protein